jgi:hypothetical protein
MSAFDPKRTLANCYFHHDLKRRSGNLAATLAIIAAIAARPMPTNAVGYRPQLGLVLWFDRATVEKSYG